MANFVAIAELPNGLIVDAIGRPRANVPVYIYQPGTTTQVTVYGTPGGVVLTQPLLTNATGYVPGYVIGAQAIDVVDQGTGNRATAEAISVADVDQPLVPVTVNAAASPYAALPNQLLLIDNTGGDVVVNYPTAPADRTRIARKIVAYTAANAIKINLGGADAWQVVGGLQSEGLSELGHSKVDQYAATSSLWVSTGESRVRLPRFRGFWAPSTKYSRDDVIICPIFAANIIPQWVLRWCDQDHVSPATFSVGSRTSSPKWYILNENGTFRGPFLVLPPNNTGLSTVLSTALTSGTAVTSLPVAGGLSAALTAGQTVTLVSGSNSQTFTVSGNPGVGATTITVSGSPLANFSYPTGTAVLGSALPSALATTAQITSLPLSAALAALVKQGEILQLQNGSNYQNFVVASDTAAGAMSVPVTPQTPNFAWPIGTAVARPAFEAPIANGGFAAQYAPLSDIVISPTNQQLVRPLYSSSQNGGVYDPTQFADLHAVGMTLAAQIHPDLHFSMPGSPQMDNIGHGLFRPPSSRIRIPRVKPMALFQTTADFDSITNPGATLAGADPDPAQPGGAPLFHYNTRAAKTLSQTWDLSTSMVRVLAKSPGSGQSRAGFTNTYLEVSSSGVTGFTNGNYARYDLVPLNDNKLGDNVWGYVGCGPTGWTQVGTGATLTAINAIRFDLVAANTNAVISFQKIEAIPINGAAASNGADASLGNGTPWFVPRFDDSDSSAWQIAVPLMHQYGFTGIMMAGGEIDNPPGTPTSLTPQQHRYMSLLGHWQFCLHYYLAADGKDPYAQQHPVFSKWAMRGKFGLASAGVSGYDDYGYHDNTHQNAANYWEIVKLFRSAQKYSLTENEIEQLPPIDRYGIRSRGVAQNDIYGVVSNLSGTLTAGNAVTSIPLYQSIPLNVILPVGTPLMVQQLAKVDMFTVATQTAYTDTAIAVTSHAPANSYTAGTGTSIIAGIGLLSGTLTGGSAVTTINLQAGLANPVYAGMVIVVTADGQNTDYFQVTAQANAGATAISVLSRAPVRSYAAGALVYTPGDLLRAMIDRAITAKGLYILTWDPSITPLNAATGAPGTESLLRNVLAYADVQRANIKTGTLDEALRPWAVAA